MGDLDVREIALTVVIGIGLIFIFYLVLRLVFGLNYWAAMVPAAVVGSFLSVILGALVMRAIRSRRR